MRAPAVRRLRYGEAPSQEGDLYLPSRPRPPVVALLHGGFWRAPHGRDQFDAVARDLTGKGFAVWTLGYRRVGEAGGGFPGTLLDIDAGLDRLAVLAAEGVCIDLERVAVVGHSAGGHLALWAAGRGRAQMESVRNRVRPAAAAALAPVCDLEAAFHLGVGSGAVEVFLDGAPVDVPERYAAASPRRLLPLGVRQLIVHGARDEALPAEMSLAYAEAAHAAGDVIECVSPPEAGHMDFLDPASGAFGVCRDWLERVLYSATT